MTDVQISAVLDEMTVPLYDVINWKVGTRILLNATPDDMVEMRCGDVAMFEGRMGRKGGHIAVRIEREVPKDEEIR